MSLSGFLNGDKSRLERIYQRVAAIPEGRDLLDVIEQLNLKIEFRYGKRSGTHGAFVPDLWKIKINRLASDDQIIRILAHEVRHAWQYHKMGYRQGDRIADFETSRMWTRMIEGDATSFENVFMEALCAHESRPMPPNTLTYKSVYEQLHGRSFANVEDFLSSVPVSQRRKDYFEMTQIAFGEFYDQHEYRQYHFHQMLGAHRYLTSHFSQAMTMPDIRRIFETSMRGSSENYMANSADRDLMRMIRPAGGYG